MSADYTRLEGKDLGVIIGGTLCVPNLGVVVYKPLNDKTPSIDMDRTDLESCTYGVKSVNIPSDAVSQLLVNHKPVYPSNPVYFGRGDVTIELKEEANIGSLVDDILAKKIGLIRT